MNYRLAAAFLAIGFASAPLLAADKDQQQSGVWSGLAAQADRTDDPANAVKAPYAPFEDEAIEWDLETGKNVYFPDRGEPYITLTGFVRDGFKALFNENPLDLKDGRFSIRLALPESANEFSMRVIIPQVGESSYRFSYTWKKLPPEKQFSVKIREGGKVVERATEAVAKEQPVEEWLERGPVIESRANRFYWRQFGLGFVGALDGRGGIFTGEIGWFPEYRLNRNWMITGGLLASILKSTTGNLFPAFEYRVALRAKVASQVDLEFLGGGQTWTGTGAAAFIPIVGLQASLQRTALFGEEGSMDWWRKFYLNYTFLVTNKVHFIRVGTLVSF